MSLNLLLATNTPGKTQAWLLDRGFLVNDNGTIRFRNTDIRFTPRQIPNPINSWNMYALKFVRSEDATDDDGTDPELEPDRFNRSKFVNWAKTNGTRVDFDWDVNDDGSEIIPLVAYRIDFDGGQFYIMKEHPRIHQWQ